MFDETANISAKTWTRTVDSINKEGYSDGFADGQKKTFQTSFDLGYSQGFLFGLKLGFKESMCSLNVVVWVKSLCNWLVCIMGVMNVEEARQVCLNRNLWHLYLLAYPDPAIKPNHRKATE